MPAIAAMPSRGHGLILLFSTMLVAAGCTGRSDSRVCYPVHGTVRAHGKPAVGALVTFYPMEKTDPPAPSAAGTTDSEGHFSLSTYKQDDGAPAGDYKVRIIVTNTDVVHRQAMRKGPPRKGPGSKKAQSRAAAFQAHVSEGPNELEPFEIK